MSDKSIEIRMAVTGADQAAAEVRKVEDSLEAASTGFGGMLDGVPERADEVADAVKKIDAAAIPLSEHLGEATENITDMGDNAAAADPQLQRIINIQRAQVANEIAKGLAQIGEKIRYVSKEFAESDPEFSKTLGNLSDGINAASSAAAGAAQGFAVGGPFGAAVGGLIGAAIVPLTNAFDDMVSSMSNASASQAQAAEMARRLAAAQGGAVEQVFAAGDASAALTKAYQDETAAADALISATERRNKVLAAESKADDAARDRADAKAIRNGADPETVRIDRANYDEAKKLAQIDRDIATKQTGMREISNAAIRAKGESEALKVTGAATPEQLADAEKKVKELEARLAAMQADLDEAQATAPARRREIRESTAGRIESLADQRDRRREEDAQREKDKADSESARAERERLQDTRSSAESALDATSRERGLSIRGAGNRQGNQLFQTVGKALSDGTDSNELQKLGDMIRDKQGEIGAKTYSALMAVISGLEKDAKRIDTIEARIKNLRSSK